MAYTGRILPADEYWRLELLGIPKDKLPNPDTSLVGVIEKDGAIIGRWMAVTIIAMEGLQIDEEYRRNPVVARRLLTLMLETLREKGVAAVTTIVQDKAVGELATHAGFDRLPGMLYQKDLRGT